MAEYKKDGNDFTGRGARFAVVPIEAVRMLNVRSDDEVVAAQKQINDEMITALESMIQTAKAGRIEARAALAMGAVAW